MKNRKRRSGKSGADILRMTEKEKKRENDKSRRKKNCIEVVKCILYKHLLVHTYL